jgi:hypothetical protein
LFAVIYAVRARGQTPRRLHDEFKAQRRTNKTPSAGDTLPGALSGVSNFHSSEFPQQTGDKVSNEFQFMVPLS